MFSWVPKAAAESMDMEAVGALKAEGNECFRKGSFHFV